MAEKILIMGLPGSGKTSLARELKKLLEESNQTVSWLNADAIRSKNNDWDFSIFGRIRQSERMCDLANSSNDKYVICDFIAPLPETRNNLNADWIIWMDTIVQGSYADTNDMFVVPETYDFRITEKDFKTWGNIISKHILGNRIT